jgi:hypothetical protein
MVTDASEHTLTGWAWRCQRRHAICTVTALTRCMLEPVVQLHSDGEIAIACDQRTHPTQEPHAHHAAGPCGCRVCWRSWWGSYKHLRQHRQAGSQPQHMFACFSCVCACTQGSEISFAWGVGNSNASTEVWLANRVRLVRLCKSASTRRGTLPHSEDRPSTARNRDLSLSLEQVVSDATPRTTTTQCFETHTQECAARSRKFCMFDRIA